MRAALTFRRALRLIVALTLSGMAAAEPVSFDGERDIGAGDQGAKALPGARRLGLRAVRQQRPVEIGAQEKSRLVRHVPSGTCRPARKS